VWKFSAEVNGREIIQSVVKENVQPDFFNNYGEDHRRAQSAFMMHETLPTVFKVSTRYHFQDFYWIECDFFPIS